MTRSTHIDARAEAVADDDAAAVGRLALPADLLTPLHDQLSARADPAAEAAARRLRDEIAASADFREVPALAAPAASPGAGTVPAALPAPGARPGPRLERVPTLAIRPSATLARQRLDAADLRELAASIKGNGLAQPLLVRLLSEQPRMYELFAGYRRWRAALAARVTHVPVIVFDGLHDAVALELNLLENLNRRDLTLIEEAEMFRQLVDRHGRTAGQIAALAGRSLNQVKNMLCLAALPDSVKAPLRSGQISFGHARVLLGAADPAALARRIVAERLTVRETEALAALPAATDVAPPRPTPADGAWRSDTRLLQAELGVAAGAAFEVKTDRSQPALVIRGRNEREIEAAVGLLRRALKLLRTSPAAAE
jgi:ParB family chromosome partitioning protein